MKTAVIALFVLPAALHIRATGGERASADLLYGCWRRDDSQRAGGAGAFTEICLHKDLTAERRWMESDGHGGEEGLEWYLKPGSALVIDEQSCGIVRLTDRALFLNRCIFTGDWHR